MKKRGKIDLKKLKTLVDSGFRVTEIAKKLGVNHSSVSRAIRKLNMGIARDVILRTAKDIANKKIDAMSMLRKITDSANKELDRLETVRDVWQEGLVSTRWEDQHIKYIGELRKLVGLFLDIAKTLYSVEDVREFQKIVLEEVGKENEQTQQRIIERLQSRAALRRAVGWSEE